MDTDSMSKIGEQRRILDVPAPVEAPTQAPAKEPHLLAEPIRAVRAVIVDEGGALRTINARPLKEGPEHPAICDRGLSSHTKLEDHDAPAWDCLCGYYAVSPEHDSFLDPLHWWAEVDLWGTVVEHEYGWRAQYQRIAALKAPRICKVCARMAAVVLTVNGGCLPGWCGGCEQDAHKRVAAPASLMADPRITWGTVDPAGPPPPTLAEEVAKLAKAVTGLGTLGGGVRPIPREVAKWIVPGSTTHCERIQAMNPAYYPQLRIEHHPDGWRMILNSGTGQIVWDAIIPYAAGPDPRFG